MFAAQGQGDFVRIATTLKNEKGEAVLGSRLDRAHPAYAAIQAGQSYMGLANLFGRQYMTHYRPLKDASGATVGIAFVGQDFSQLLEHFKDSIRALKVGRTGYYFVLNAEDGAQRGQLVVHPALEGRNISESRDGDGRFFIRDMLDRKEGTIAYPGPIRARPGPATSWSSSASTRRGTGSSPPAPTWMNSSPRPAA